MLTCFRCGYTGEDVRWWPNDKDWSALECDNLEDCFRRYHAQEEAELEKIELAEEK